MPSGLQPDGWREDIRLLCPLHLLRLTDGRMRKQHQQRGHNITLTFFHGLQFTLSTWTQHLGKSKGAEFSERPQVQTSGLGWFLVDSRCAALT